MTRDKNLDAANRIAVAAGAALLTAGVVLVAFVLPAEYAVDPLGTGAKVGLLELGVTGQQVEALAESAANGASQAAVNVPQQDPFHGETVELEVGPHDSVEYKYRLDQGEALLYAWRATGAVNYELHGEPDGAPRGYADSYETGQGSREESGTFTAPSSGIHGWYWENPGDQPLTITLETAGFYNVSHEFRPGAPVKNKMFR